MSAVALRQVLPLITAATATTYPPLALHVVDGAAANRSGAVCLDGSPPGFYLRKSSAAATANKWIIYMQGGAWCSSPGSCASRSTGHLGSSTKFAPTYPMEGLLDANATQNPTFADWNHVLLAYCDGGSFSGDAASGLSWPDPKQPSRNMTLYFRGRRVLKHLLGVLASDYGFGTAEEVLLAGGSAGGLATFLQADYVGSLLPKKTVTKYKAIPVSGFFLMHNDSQGGNGYVASMNATYLLHNASILPACAASVAKSHPADPGNELYRCFFANYSYEFSQTPMFPIQSVYDEYQLFAILRAGGWDAGCLNRGAQFHNCTRAQLVEFNEYRASMLADWGGGLQKGKATRVGEGAFVESCLEHVAEQKHTMYDGYSIGGVSMRDAISKWWLSDGTEPSSAHLYMPCELSLDNPHQCNPSCFAIQQQQQQDVVEVDEEEALLMMTTTPPASAFPRGKTGFQWLCQVGGAAHLCPNISAAVRSIDNGTSSVLFTTYYGRYPLLDYGPKTHGGVTPSWCNGGIPQLANLTLHASRMAIDLDQKKVPLDYTGLIVLDYEAWWPIWNATGSDLYKNASRALARSQLPAKASDAEVEAKAVEDFNRASLAFHIFSVTETKRLRPKAKVGFYSGILTSYWHEDPAHDAYVLQAQLPWWEVVDVIMPDVYLPYASPRTQPASKLLAYVERRLQAATQLNALLEAAGRQKKEIIPYVWARYHGSHDPEALSLLSDADAEIEFFSEGMKAVASRAILWGSEGDANATASLEWFRKHEARFDGFAASASQHGKEEEAAIRRRGDVEEVEVLDRQQSPRAQQAPPIDPRGPVPPFEECSL